MEEKWCFCLLSAVCDGDKTCTVQSWPVCMQLAEGTWWNREALNVYTETLQSTECRQLMCTSVIGMKQKHCLTDSKIFQRSQIFLFKPWRQLCEETSRQISRFWNIPSIMSALRSKPHQKSPNSPFSYMSMHYLISSTLFIFLHPSTCRPVIGWWDICIN